MTRLLEDRTLLEAFRRGERAALAEVYRAFAPDLVAFLASGFSVESGGQRSFVRGIRERWAREDAVQEIFARAYAPAARLAYDGLRPYRNYLLTIARNYLVDSFRARAREPVLEEQAVAEMPADGASPGAPDELAGSKELAAQCEAFAGSLSPRERSVFDCRFRQGLSIEETARRLRSSEHRVKRDEARLRKRFFFQMRTNGYFEGYGFSRTGLIRSALRWMAALGVIR